MPQVPLEAAPETGPSPAPDLTVRVNTSPDTFGAAIGRGLSQAGQEFQQIGEQQQSLKNDADARNMGVDYATKVGQLQTDFYSKTGQDAVNARPGFIKAITDLRAQTLAGAPNPMVGKMVDDQMARETQLSIMGADRHSADQLKVYNKQTLQSQIELQQQDAGNLEKSSDHASFQGYIDGIKSSTDELYKESDPATRQLKELENVGGAMEKRLSNMAATDPGRANQLLTHFRSSMDGDSADRAQKYINQQYSRVQGGKIADGIFSGGPTTSIDDKQKYMMGELAPVVGKAGAAALVGGMAGQENTSLDPTLSNASGHHGIAQWGGVRLNGNDQQAGLNDWAKKQGMDPEDFRTQVAFVKFEVTQGAYKNVGDRLRSTSDVMQASLIANQGYEGSGEAPDSKEQANRTNKALQLSHDSDGTQFAGGIKDISGGSTYNKGSMDGDPKGFIFHHTGSRGTPEQIQQTLNQRGLGVQYIMDRDGSVYKSLPDGARGAHILPSQINDLSNANSMGMEVIANNNDDVTPAQIASGKAFAASVKQQYPNIQFYGHGEVNPGHKQADEGLTLATIARGGAAPNMSASAPAGPIPIGDRTLGNYMRGNFGAAAVASKLASGNIPQAGIDATSGPGALERAQNEARTTAMKQAMNDGITDPEVIRNTQDMAASRVGQRYAEVTRAHTDLLNQDMQSVNEAMMTGKYKTIDDLRQDPALSASISRMPPNKQIALGKEMARLTDPPDDAIAQQKYNRMVGLAQDNPQQYMQEMQNLSDMGLPNKYKQDLISKSSNVMKGMTADPSLSAATSYLRNTGFYDQNGLTDKEEQHTFNGSLAGLMKTFKDSPDGQGKNPTNDQVEKMAKSLVIRQAGTGLSSYIFSQPPRYKEDIPPEFAGQATKWFRGKFPQLNRDPSQTEIRNLYDLHMMKQDAPNG